MKHVAPCTGCNHRPEGIRQQQAPVITYTSQAVSFTQFMKWNLSLTVNKKKMKNIKYLYFVIMTNKATSLQATLTQSQSLTAVQMSELPITQQG